MAQLTKRNLAIPPLNAQNKDKIRARIDKLESGQGAAANLTTNEIVEAAGKVLSLIFIANDIAAAGESLTIDVLKEGVSILTAPYAYDATAAAKTRIDLPLVADTVFALGDLLTVSRTYVAGGGPTPLGANKVVMEIA